MILAAASKKEVLSDLLNELILQMAKVSPALIPSGIDVPSIRPVHILNDSFMILSNNGDHGPEKIEFISLFISTHIRYHGKTAITFRTTDSVVLFTLVSHSIQGRKNFQ